jgi:hypothetical protein
MTSGDGQNKTEEKPVSKAVNFSLRLTILVLLAVQNAAHALMSRYSKVKRNHFNLTALTTSSHQSSFTYQGILKETYSGTEVVLVGEVIKLFVAGIFSMKDTAETGFKEFLL